MIRPRPRGQAYGIQASGAVSGDLDTLYWYDDFYGWYADYSWQTGGWGVLPGAPNAGENQITATWQDDNTPPFYPESGTGNDGPFYRYTTVKLIQVNVGTAVDYVFLGETAFTTETVNLTATDGLFAWYRPNDPPDHPLRINFLDEGEEVPNILDSDTATMLAKTASESGDDTWVQGTYWFRQVPYGVFVHADAYEPFTVVGPTRLVLSDPGNAANKMDTAGGTAYTLYLAQPAGSQTKQMNMTLYWGPGSPPLSGSHGHWTILKSDATPTNSWSPGSGTFTASGGATITSSTWTEQGSPAEREFKVRVWCDFFVQNGVFDSGETVTTFESPYVTVVKVEIKDFGGANPPKEYVAVNNSVGYMAKITPEGTGVGFAWTDGNGTGKFSFDNPALQTVTITAGSQPSSALNAEKATVVVKAPVTAALLSDSTRSQEFTIFNVAFTEPPANSSVARWLPVTWGASVTPSGVPSGSMYWDFSYTAGNGYPTGGSGSWNGAVREFASAPLTTGTVTMRAQATVSGSAASAQRSVDVKNVFLKSVSFGGTKYHEVVADNCSTSTYSAPHWLDASSPADGDANDTGDRKYPVCYTRATAMTATVVFTTSGTLSGNLRIKGTGPDNLIFPSTAATINGPELSATITCSAAFANAVDFFDPMTISWSLSADQGTNWYQVGSSANQVYVTLYDPSLSVIHHTVAHLSCKNAEGLTGEDAITSAVWSEFTDRSVTRVENPVQLTYYADYRTDIWEYGPLLATGDGQCNSWRELFEAMLKAQGLADPGSRYDYDPSLPFAVKNWDFVTTGTSGISGFPYLNVAVGGTPGSYPEKQDYMTAASYCFPYHEATDETGIPGQGNGNPASLFGSHYVQKRGNILYDASYGVTYQYDVAHPNADLEQKAVDGYWIYELKAVSESAIGVDLDGDGYTTGTLQRWCFYFRKP